LLRPGGNAAQYCVTVPSASRQPDGHPVVACVRPVMTVVLMVTTVLP
jgi:hypothetical protein